MKYRNTRLDIVSVAADLMASGTKPSLVVTATLLLGQPAAASDPTTDIDKLYDDIEENELSDSGHGHDEQAWNDSQETLWVPQLFLGGKPGTDRTIGQVAVTIPFTQDPNLIIFNDTRLRFDDNDTYELNIGLAIRYAWTDDLIIGAYGFFDALRSENDNSFIQGTVGLEALGDRWQVRANGYIPEERIITLANMSGNSIEVSGNQISVRRSVLQETALHGFDIEAGYRPFDEVDLWVYGGYFHFEDFADAGFETVNGPRIRAEWKIRTDEVAYGSYLSVGGEWQDDGIDDEAFALIQFRIPLGGSKATRRANEWEMQWRYWAMQSRIVRDIDVVSSTTVRQFRSPAVNPTSGQSISGIYFAAPGGIGDGTFESPTSLDTALTNAGANGIVVVSGAVDENGDPVVIDTSGITLLNGATLMGANSNLTVGVTAGLTQDDADQELLSVTVPGLAPTIRGIGANTVVVNDGASNVSISNVNITGSSADAILASNNTDLTLRDVTVDEPGGNAVTIQNSDGLTIENLTITAGGGDGVTITDATDLDRDVVLTGLAVTVDGGNGLTLVNAGAVTASGSVNTTGGHALEVRDTQLDATFSSLTSQDSAGAGVVLDAVSGSLRVTGPTSISEPTAEGLAISNPATGASVQFGTVSVTNSSTIGLGISDVDATGVDLQFGNVTVNGDSATTGQGLMIENVTGADANLSFGSVTTEDTPSASGIEISNVTGDVSFASASVTDSGGAGISIHDSDATIAFSGNVTINDTVDSGIEITATGGELTFAGVSVTDARGDGIELSQLSGTVQMADVTVRNHGDPGAGVRLSEITADGVEMQLGDIDASNLMGGQGLVIENISGNNVSLVTGDVTVDDSGAEGVVVDQVAGSGFMLDIKDVDVTDSVGRGIAVTNIAGDQGSVNFRNSMITVTGADVPGIVVQGVDSPTAFTINFDGATITMPNDSPTNGVLIDTVGASGGMVEVLFGDVRVLGENLMGLPVGRTNNGPNVNIDFNLIN